MKNEISILRFLVFLCFFAGSSSLTYAQESTDSVKPRKIRLSLSYSNINNTGPRLLATIKTKVDRTYVTLEDVKVDFYFGENGGVLLGSMNTDKKGEALFLVPEILRKTIDTTDIYYYRAVVDSNPTIVNKDKEVEIRRSKLSLEFTEVDSVKLIRFGIQSLDSAGQLIPIADLNPVCYIERLFGLLPISDDLFVTDEEGLCEMEFPDNIPGDSSGNLKVVVKIEDHDEYGTLIAMESVDWGLPYVSDERIEKRELWSSGANAPLYLVFIITSSLIGIVLVILYIFYSLFLIKKMGN